MSGSSRAAASQRNSPFIHHPVTFIPAYFPSGVMECYAPPEVYPIMSGCTRHNPHYLAGADRP
jgi:hypothetical protein